MSEQQCSCRYAAGSARRGTGSTALFGWHAAVQGEVHRLFKVASEMQHEVSLQERFGTKEYTKET